MNIKSSKMNIQAFLQASQKQFSGLRDQQAKSIIEKYAAKELLLTGQQLTKYVLHTIKKDNNHYPERFYTWYALNYGIAEDWSIRIHCFELYDIDQIKIYPMQQYEEDGDILVRKCEKDLADYWSVYACSKNEEYCIADCKNEIIATHFEDLLRTIISRWKIKVLLYDNTAGKRYIYSSHGLNLMMIDRKGTIEHNEPPRLNSILLLGYSSPGTFYQDIPAITDDDLLIKSMIREAHF